MNLELPFSDLTDAELDAYLAQIDERLDALFLDEVQAKLNAARAEPADPASPVITAA